MQYDFNGLNLTRVYQQVFNEPRVLGMIFYFFFEKIKQNLNVCIGWNTVDRLVPVCLQCYVSINAM